MSDSETFPASGAKPSGAGDSHTSLQIRPDAGPKRAVSEAHRKALLQNVGVARAAQRRLREERVLTLGPFSQAASAVTRKKLGRILSGAKQRCRNPNKIGYDWYGGKGVKVTAPWNTDTAAFVEWALARGWVQGLELDRIDSSGNYCPENCQIVTHDENMQRIQVSEKMRESARRACLARAKSVACLVTGHKAASQTELAKLFGISTALMSMLLSGKRKSEKHKIVRI